MAKKRGTRADYKSYGGREIKAIVDGKETGICQDKNGLYYYMYDDPKTGKRKKKTCTTDIKIAYNRFMTYVEGKRAEEFLSANNIKLEKIVRAKFKDVEGIDSTKMTVTGYKTPDGQWHTTNIEVPSDYAKRIFYEDTIKVSEQEFFHWLESYRGKEEELKRKSGTAIEFLGKTDRETHIKLKTILDFFKHNIKFKTQKTKDDYGTWIEHFFNFTEVIYIDDVTEDIVRKYETEYLDPTREAGDPDKPVRKSYAYKWKNDRAGAIKRALGFYAEKHPSISATVKKVREYLMIWDRTKDKKILDPECVSKEDFSLLYRNANIKWKAILLMSLNTMSYAKDISDMEISHINKSRKTLKMVREKEGSLKVGFLWDETIKALEEYEKIRKKAGQWLFTSNHKGKYEVASLQNYIREFCKNNKIKDKLSVDNVTFEMLRNGSSTAADDGELEHHYIEYGLGHQMSGSFSNYVKGRPERMKLVADNIYREYEIDRLKLIPTPPAPILPESSAP